jgi:hypothetical protein
MQPLRVHSQTINEVVTALRTVVSASWVTQFGTAGFLVWVCQLLGIFTVVHHIIFGVWFTYSL